MREPPSEEKLTGTLVSAIRRLPKTLGGLSTTIGLVGLTAVAVGLVVVAFFQELRTYGLTIMAIGGILAFLSLALSYRTVRTTMAERRGRYGTNTAIMVTAFVASSSWPTSSPSTMS